MVRKRSPVITDGELRLMRILWDAGPSTAPELQRELDPELAQSTIRTLLGILVKKGLARRWREGRPFVYEAVVGRQKSERRAVIDLVDRFFGTPGDLVLNVVRTEDLEPSVLAELKRLVEAKEAAGDGDSGADT